MEIINSSIINLDGWLNKNGWAGYDPYDIKGEPFFLHVQRLASTGSIPFKVVRELVFALEASYPLIARRMFGVKEEINPKAMGLFARAYLNLFQATGQEVYKDKALYCLMWLEQNPSQGYSGLCWGYPFDWQSQVLIPAGTPSAVVSSVVGDGFWTAYQVLGDRHYLAICESICKFFLCDLNMDRLPGGHLCFSYTPVDNFHVHNANLFVAEFLCRIGKETGKQELVEIGSHAAGYALSEQNPDGSLYYWGRIQNSYSPNTIDHYHSGFEIRALFGLWKQTGEAKYRQSVEKYYSFYRNNLITQRDGLIAPKMTPRKFYPVNIHACAEAILCNATLAEEFLEARKILPDLCEWVISKMQTEAGWFIYMIRRAKSGENRAEVPYMRWGQAWMLLALSQVLLRIGLVTKE